MAPAVTLAELTTRPIWVAWKIEIRNGRKTKVPYCPRTGRKAASDNPATWGTHDEAARWSERSAPTASA
jgi:putative DNA primase/helicase